MKKLTNKGLDSGIQDLSGGEFVASLLQTLVTAAVIIGGLIFFFMLLAGAIQYMQSGGDKTALEEAQGKIKNAFIGLFILFSSWAIAKMIETIFGVNILLFDLSTLAI